MPGRIAATFRVGSARQRVLNKRPVRAFGKCGGGTMVKRQVPGTQLLGSCWLHSGTQCDLLPKREMHSPSTGKGYTAFPGINEPRPSENRVCHGRSLKPQALALLDPRTGQSSWPLETPFCWQRFKKGRSRSWPLSGPPLGALTCLFSPAPP